jgi:predicted dehydrogenase
MPTPTTTTPATATTVTTATATAATTQAIVVGSGKMARAHILTMLEPAANTSITGIVEPDAAAQAATAAIFAAQGLVCPAFFDSIAALLASDITADAAFICTPHKYHLENTRDCLLAGLDVCLEKPMVMNVAEAEALLRLRDQSGGLLLVAFPGSLSPAIWHAKRLMKAGVLGQISAISAFAHQHWQQATAGTWRQDPAISGGGFLFDTGSHMVNTVVDLIDADIATVTALLDQRGTAVEIASVVSGVANNGILFSLTGAGDSIHCTSEITVFGTLGVLKTGIWGERLALKTVADPDFLPLPYAASSGPWQQFLKVRAGELENPCPGEIGLRFAKLMEMIRESNATGRAVRAG